MALRKITEDYDRKRNERQGIVWEQKKQLFCFHAHFSRGLRALQSPAVLQLWHDTVRISSSQNRKDFSLCPVPS